MYYGVVYKITCSETDKSYIGRTKNTIKDRWYQHRTAGSNCVYLKRAIQKYGKDSFTIEVIASSWDKENLKELEALLIKQEDTLAPHGYNLINNGEGIDEISEETREKHRTAMIGNKHAVGTVYTDELRVIKSEVAKIQWTPEKRAKRSEQQKGNKNVLGRIQSDEERARRSESNRKSEKAAAQRIRLAECNKGKQHALGHRHTQEELNKIADASKQQAIAKHGVTFNGETLTVPDWAKRVGVATTTMARRIKAWGMEKAVSTTPGPQAIRYSHRK